MKLYCIGITLLILNGCATALDKTLSPPPDTQWVNVEIKNPSPYTRPFPLEVVYISDVCKKRYISDSDGSLKTEISYNGKTILLEREGSSDIYRARVAMTGGGTCQWKLSEFNLGIEYIDAKHLGKDLVPGTAVGATIAFDNLAAQDGEFEDVYGDLMLTPKYFPLTHENKRLSNKTKLNLFSNEDFLSIRMHFNSKDLHILYFPSIDESKIVKMIAPQKPKFGEFYRIIYPDGTITSDGATHPDFDKVENMKAINTP